MRAPRTPSYSPTCPSSSGSRTPIPCPSCYNLPMSNQQPPQAQLTAWTRSRSTAVPWQLRYLIARSKAPDDNSAVRKAGVSVPIVIREAQRDPEFAALRLQAIERTLVLGNDDTTQLARDGMPHIMQRAIERATDETGDVRDRDQVAWGRLAGDAAGVTGPAAAAPGLTIVNTGELTMIGYQLHQAALAPAPAPVIDVTPAPAHIPARVKPADAPTE